MKSLRRLSARNSRETEAPAGPIEHPDLPLPFDGVPAEVAGEPVPDELFSRSFYKGAYPNVVAGELGPRQHFASGGREEGRVPSLGMVYVAEAVRLRSATSTTPMADTVALLPPDQRHRAVNDVIWKRLRHCVHPDFYAAQLDEDGRAELHALDLPALDAAVAHFLARGVHQGLRPGALFNLDFYLAALDERGLEPEQGSTPFFDWLTRGWTAQIVPTPLYDEDFYRQRHPSVRNQEWAFQHYLTRGCYETHWYPSPTGRHHDNPDDSQARAQQRPLLLTQMLHRGDEHDLSRTSWLEAGQTKALDRRRRFLESPRVAELVAKVAAIEPLVLHPRSTNLTVSIPPYRQGRVHLYEKTEQVRRALDSASYDAVLVVPDGDPTAAHLAGVVADELHARQPGTRLLLLAEGELGPDPTPQPAGSVTTTLDLRPFIGALDEARRVDLLLDVVRGTKARQVITVCSALGRELIRAYGRQMATRAELAVILEPELEPTLASRFFEECFARLSWLLVTETERAGLVERFVLPEAGRARLFGLDPDDPEPGVRAAMTQPRRDQ